MVPPPKQQKILCLHQYPVFLLYPLQVLWSFDLCFAVVSWTSGLLKCSTMVTIDYLYICIYIYTHDYTCISVDRAISSLIYACGGLIMWATTFQTQNYVSMPRICYGRRSAARLDHRPPSTMDLRKDLGTYRDWVLMMPGGVWWLDLF